MTGGSRAAPLTTLGSGLAEGLGRSGLVVGVGIDAVEIDRFARALARRTKMADRLFTAGELAYARAAADPAPRLSTRFAAKEATMKALGVGLGAFSFHDVEVVRIGLDAPWLVLHGPAEELARRAGVSRWHLSLAPTDRTALAVVVADHATGPTGPTGLAGVASPGPKP